MTSTVPVVPAPVPVFSVRGRRVVLDADLARLMEVPTKRLNERVRRTPARFPADSTFLLSAPEWDSIRALIGSRDGRAPYRRYLPYVFTNRGVLMAANVLRSARAVEFSIFVIRTSTAMRDALLDTGEPWRQAEFKRALDRREKGLGAIAEILRTVSALSEPERPGS